MDIETGANHNLIAKKTPDDSRELDYVYETGRLKRKWASFWMLLIDFVAVLIAILMFISFEKGVPVTVRGITIVGLIFSITSYVIVLAVRLRPEPVEIVTGARLIGNTVYYETVATSGSSLFGRLITFAFMPCIIIAETAAIACTYLIWTSISATITDRMFGMKTRYLFVASAVMALLRFGVAHDKSAHYVAMNTMMIIVMTQFVITFIFNICYTDKSREDRIQQQEYPRMAYNKQAYTITKNCYYNFTKW